MNTHTILTIGIDVRDLKVAKTGQKTVTEELCRQFAAYNDNSVRFIFLDTRFPAYTGRKKIIILLEHIRYQAWKQLILPIKAWYHHCDIVFCGDYFAPYLHLGFKTVEIFYDAFFFEYPEHYNRPWRMLFHGLAIPAAKRCSYIMTITDYARKKIHSYTGIAENKLVTIYPGPKSLPITNIATSVPPHLSMLARHRYILHVGVMEKRKNLPALIYAFNRLKEVYHEPIKLVLVGQGNGKVFSDDSEQVNAAIRDCGLENEVILLGYLPDEEVAIAYRHAFMYVFPSFNEGFGIPVMEAFTFGIPVLVADNSCLPEVGGDAVVTFNPFDKEDMVVKMKQVLQDEALRKELIEKGYKRLQYFSWKKAADQLVAVFKSAHEEA